VNVTRVSRLPAAGALVVLFLACSWTTAHYWDEYFYLFSVSRHSVATLLSLEPALSDGIFPNGFFSGKLAFVVMLRGLLAALGSDATGIMVTRSLFALMTIGVAAATWRLMGALVDDHRIAAGAAAALLLSPLGAYLGFKVMSETPALLAATVGGWQFVEAVRSRERRTRMRGLAIAAAGFAAAALFRVTAVLFPAGLIAAAAIVRPHEPGVRGPGSGRPVRPVDSSVRRILLDGLLTCLMAGILIAVTIVAAVDAPLERFGGLAGSVTERSPGMVVVIYAGAVFSQLFFVLLLAALRPMNRIVAAALVWLGISMLPYVLSAQYVEPRFFYTGLPAFALLAAIGVRNLTARLPPARQTMAAAAILAGFAVVDRAAFAALMPYELRESGYSALVDEVDARRPQASLVTPWISDFCYLTLTFPERRVALAMSETYGTGRVFGTPEFQRWIGPSVYAGNAEELESLPAPRVYVGWEYSPTVEALDRYLRPLHFAYLDDPRRRAGLLNHLTPSWIWRSSRYRLEPLASHHGYRAFDILARDGS
jgi:hypothetical protein